MLWASGGGKHNAAVSLPVKERQMTWMTAIGDIPAPAMVPNVDGTLSLSGPPGAV